MVKGGEILAGRYRLDRILGRGGLATTWAATNVKLDRQVALKILNDDFLRDERLVERFLRGARLASKNVHPTIVRVEDIGETEGGAPFLVMELLQGRTLAHELKGRGSMPVSESLEVIRPVLEGLAALHDQGIIHRDIKPSSIFLLERETEGTSRVRLLGMTIAEAISEHDPDTAQGVIVGTPAYMAPELFHNGPPALSIDTFAAGIVFFQMLTGQGPFDLLGSDRPSLLVYIRRLSEADALKGPKDVAPSVPNFVDAVARKALATKPADRYQNAGEMLRALEEAASERESISPREPIEAPLDAPTLALGGQPWRGGESPQVEVEPDPLDASTQQMGGQPWGDEGPPRSRPELDPLDAPTIPMDAGELRRVFDPPSKDLLDPLDAPAIHLAPESRLHRTLNKPKQPSPPPEPAGVLPRTEPSPELTPPPPQLEETLVANVPPRDSATPAPSSRTGPPPRPPARAHPSWDPGSTPRSSRRPGIAGRLVVSALLLALTSISIASLFIEVFPTLPATPPTRWLLLGAAGAGVLLLTLIWLVPWLRRRSTRRQGPATAGIDAAPGSPNPTARTQP